MLEKIVLRNFQCHRTHSLELDGLLTKITGTSNSGKSAIIRALYWVVTNRPRGKAFISHGKKSCAVQLRFRGMVVTRRRGQNNSYQLSGETFKAVNSKVPEEVSEALRINPRLTFQLQHDPPFLLSSPPVEAGNFINETVKLTQIQECLEWVKIRRKAAKDRFDSIEKEKANQDGLIKDADKILEMRPLWEEWSKTGLDLLNMKTSMEEMKTQLTAAKKIIDSPLFKVDLKEIISYVEDIIAGEKFLGEFKTDRSSLKGILKAIRNIQSAVENHYKANDLTELSALLENAKVKENKAKSLRAILKMASTLDKETEQSEIKIQDLKKKTKGEVCPLCKSTLR